MIFAHTIFSLQTAAAHSANSFVPLSSITSEPHHPPTVRVDASCVCTVRPFGYPLTLTLTAAVCHSVGAASEADRSAQTRIRPFGRCRSHTPPPPHSVQRSAFGAAIFGEIVHGAAARTERFCVWKLLRNVIHFCTSPPGRSKTKTRRLESIFSFSLPKWRPLPRRRPTPRHCTMICV